MTDKLTILIVDDEIVSRYTLGALLEEDYTLVFAEDGPQGLEKAETIIPDLILLDVMMPGMNGFEVCRRLRAHPLLANLPVAMITAWDDPTARSRCLEIGADEVICKPFNRASLDTLIHDLTQPTNNKNSQN